tara:strand:+ start:3426 stop:3602 length:177 start_codon:yes stop_codon:yes gene_type:complete
MSDVFEDEDERKYIVSSQISVEWSDNPKLVVLMNDMPEYVRQPFDEWLSEIEEGENDA